MSQDSYEVMVRFTVLGDSPTDARRKIQGVTRNIPGFSPGSVDVGPVMTSRLFRAKEGGQRMQDVARRFRQAWERAAR